ncbi:uncharacterized protein LOC122258743, partial [Penaeus japonicus]|uniref:uncharacterized protein LOC122258743 n=1 Tax=Penaeus japonicus TaxID=27405 RepID=UPI001C714C99
DGSAWDEQVVDRIPGLIELLVSVSNWVIRQPAEDDRFRQTLHFTSDGSEGTNISLLLSHTKHCEYHGTGRHDSADCQVLNGSGPSRGWSAVSRGRPRGRGQTSPLPTSRYPAGVQRGRGYEKGRGTGQGRGFNGGRRFRARGVRMPQQQDFGNMQVTCFVFGKADHYARNCTQRADLHIPQTRLSKNGDQTTQPPAN